MQLLIKRGRQQTGGIINPKYSFVSTVRAQYTEEERALINKYEIGGSVIYDSAQTNQYLEAAGKAGSAIKTVGFLVLAKMGLSITVASLQKGHQIMCADLSELLDCENAVVEACKGVRGYLEAAETFDGREIVVDLDEEQPVAH